MTKEADRFFSALLTEADTGKYIRMGDIGAVFTHVPSDLEHFEFIQEFMKKYGKLPKLKTFNEKTGKKLKKKKEYADYYYDVLVERHITKTLIKSAQIANTHIKNKEAQQAYEVMRGALETLALQKSAPKILDFKESHDMLKHELIQKNEPDYGINIGWDYFDNMNGSLRAGDLTSIVGRTSLGKSWMMLFIALYAWKKHRKPILFFSMEMDIILIMERLSAMYQSIPYNRVKLGQFPKGLRGKDTRKEFFDSMLELGDSDMPPFNIVGGNLTTNIDEIIALSRQLQPEAVFVDGAYLVKTTQRFQKHERIGYVADSLKSDIGANLGIPVFASWQFNKEVTKLKKGQKVGTEHIGGADEIGNVSSIVMGLFEEESSSTIRQRRVEIVKGRGGERGSFFINWNFRTMDFEQVEEIQDYKLMRT